MDREIPKQELRRKRNKRYLLIIVAALAVLLPALFIPRLFIASADYKDLKLPPKIG